DLVARLDVARVRLADHFPQADGRLELPGPLAELGEGAQDLQVAGEQAACFLEGPDGLGRGVEVVERLGEGEVGADVVGPGGEDPLGPVHDGQVVAAPAGD